MNRSLVLGGFRTPIGRRRGVLEDTHPAELLGDLMRVTLDRLGVDPRWVEQVIAGCVTTYGDQAGNIARTAWLTAGLSQDVPGVTVDARCGSSQQAVHYAAGLIASGSCELVVCGGVEHMSRHPLGQDVGADAGNPFDSRYRELYEHIAQGEAAERIADRWGVDRRQCDEIAVASQERAAAAITSGRLAREIVPVRTPGGETVGTDQGPRPSTMETLGALAPVFRPEGGVLTAGNSSQISDGASCLVLASEQMAERLGTPALAEVEHQVLVGVDPVLKLIGPVPATARILAKSDLTMDDIAVAECNEAFASVVGAWLKETGAAWDKANVNGGAIALGHPVGATGARLLLTAAQEIHLRGAHRALVTMCCGGGLGTATILRNAQL